MMFNCTAEKYDASLTHLFQSNLISPPSSAAAALFNVFVGNLSWSTTNEDLKTFFRSSGNLVGVEVQLHDDTRRSKGWG